jgi:hypothetical protein
MTDTQATILAAVIGLVGGAIGIIGTYIGSVKLTRINSRKCRKWGQVLEYQYQKTITTSYHLNLY